MENNRESIELRDRISGLSDEELLNMVEVEPFEYRAEALGYAKAELLRRGIQFRDEGRTSDEDSGSQPLIIRRLTNCKDTAEAGLLEGLLTGNGVDCEIRGLYRSMASGEIPFGECYPEVWVSDEDFDRAMEILDEWQNNKSQRHASWICKGCGESNEGQFISCWSCGRDDTPNDDQPGSST